MDEYLCKCVLRKPTVVDGEDCELVVTLGLWKPRGIEQPYNFTITCMEKIVNWQDLPYYSSYPFFRGDDGYRHGGADHEYICKHFPELRKFIDLHLCERDGTPAFGYDEKKFKYFTADEMEQLNDIFTRMRVRRLKLAYEFEQFIREHA
jgi:hypothetical protein